MLLKPKKIISRELNVKSNRDRETLIINHKFSNIDKIQINAMRALFSSKKIKLFLLLRIEKFQNYDPKY